MGIVLTLFAVVNARITDYSHSNYIPVMDGEVMVWEQRSYLRHSSNLTEFAAMLDETDRLTTLFPQSHMRKLLDVDIDHARNLLSALKIRHRIARGIDFLGTVLKVVAGTPDAADFERIRMTESQLIESNNRQVVINTITQKRINGLTETVNKLLKERKGDVTDTPHLYESLLARNRILISEIQNLMLSITLARSNIINPSIFDHDDLKSILSEHPTEVPIVNLMEVSNIKIFPSDNIVRILIDYPQIKFICKKVTMFPWHTKTSCSS